MGNLPPIDTKADTTPDLPPELPTDQPVRIPIAVHTPQAWMDHHFQGRPVLPAVAAMEALARCVRENFPRLRLDHLTDARFEKFLPMATGSDRLDAFAEFRQLAGGGVRAALLTRTKAPKAAFTRTKVHVSVTFEPAPAKPVCPPMDIAAALEGVCSVVEPQAIYRELVPFGPAFRNIVAPLYISPDGALARIETPRSSDDGGATPSLLGCGYALDAAFHAACVWAQHYHGVVAFPVAIDRRILLKPAGPAAIYTARILPREKVEDTLIFDIILMDQAGQLREMALGVGMRDVSGGRLTPPQWIRNRQATDPLTPLDAAGGKRTVVELDAVADFACQALTIREAERFEKMGGKRRKSFLAARIALKRLYRRCQIGPDDQPADTIQTVRENSPIPCLGGRQGASPMHCSVSHDRRFSIAVADAKPLGVDVEVLSASALESARLFMRAAEQDLLGHTPMKDDHAAVRIWSIKECAAKATGMNLAEAWRRTEVSAVGENQSALTIDGQCLYAHHAALAGHLFTILSLWKESNMTNETTPTLDTFIEQWQETAEKNKAAFLHLKTALEGKEGTAIEFLPRPGVTYSLRARHHAQKDKGLFVMVDVIEDDPRWLSVCFYGEMITDPEERGDFVPEGLLGEDAVCFDIDAWDDDLIRYVETRLDEAWRHASQ